MTSDLLHTLERHQPLQILAYGSHHTQHLECQGRGCFFLTHGGDGMWLEFAQHQVDMIHVSGNGNTLK